MNQARENMAQTPESAVKASHKLRCILVDDEPYVRADLRCALAVHTDIDIVGEAGTLEEARALCQSHELDVIFLDIQLRGGNGFALLSSVPANTRIVFVTAFDHYAVKAFEVEALDYLLKPVSSERLAETIARLRRQKSDVSKVEQAPHSVFDSDDRLYLKTDSAHFIVAVREIVAITTFGGNYTTVCRSDGNELVVRRSLKEWEDVLPFPPFVRIHRQSFINCSYVESFERDNSIYLIKLATLPAPLQVSRRLAATVKEALKHSRS